MNKHCLPCTSAAAKLTPEEQVTYQKELHSDWEIINNHHLKKCFKFSNFKDALSFTNKVGAIAEEEGHHPDIALSWGKVVITLWTHKIDGLSESDFILSNLIDSIHLSKKVCF